MGTLFAQAHYGVSDTASAPQAQALALAIPILLVVGGLGYALLATLAKHWRAVRESEHLAVIKQQMLDRGMSADDIAKVINAGVKKADHVM